MPHSTKQGVSKIKVVIEDDIAINSDTEIESEEDNEEENEEESEDGSEDIMDELEDSMEKMKITPQPFRFQKFMDSGLAFMDAIATDTAMKVLDDIALDTTIKIIQHSQILRRSTYPIVVNTTSRHFQSAIRILFPGEICKHAMSKGTKIVAELSASDAPILPNPYVPLGQLLDAYDIKYDTVCAVGYLGAAMEYLLEELIELACVNAQERDRVPLITAKNIENAIKRDIEFSKLFHDRVIKDGGVPEYIHPSLLEDDSVDNIAIKEIRELQATTKQILPKLPFKRIVREIAQDFCCDMRFSVDAFEALQTITEDHMVNMFRYANDEAISNKRKEIYPKDMQKVINAKRRRI